MTIVPMEMVEPERLILRTDSAFQMVDLTARVEAMVTTSGIAEGAVNLFCPHTSCGLAITELEDGLHADLEAVLEELAPVGRTYVHDDLVQRWQNLEPDERRNGWSHIRGLLSTTPSLVIPVMEARLALGRWQRLFLVELDGPRPERGVLIHAWGRRRTGVDPS